MTTFPEAYEQFGRDSAAIAEACGISEAAAYNMMARRVEFEHSPSAAARSIRQEFNQRQREKFRRIASGISSR